MNAAHRFFTSKIVKFIHTQNNSVLKAPNLLNDGIVMKVLKFNKAPYFYLLNSLYTLWDIFLFPSLVLALIIFQKHTDGSEIQAIGLLMK